MIFKINHQTTYEYTQPIFPEPSHLYFCPAARPYFQVLSYRLEVDPEPAGLSQRLDVENNLFYQMWFSDSVSKLSIDMEMLVEVEPYNPFDFLVETEPKTPHEEAVAPYLRASEELTPDMHQWIHNVAKLTSDRLTYVTMIARDIGEKWEHKLRYNSRLLTAQECFEGKQGSCRDLSWMLIQLMRHSHIPARFISGYAYNPELEGHELHGWTEVWLRGAGWVAVDPVSGLLATEKYIPLAASYHPVNTLPVQGTFRGQAEAKLTTEVSINPHTE